jgi:bifunctional DNA-binding transcriptional regulator/antitoxin component of YhaV-PrlF toxin-antitoxin module
MIDTIKLNPRGQLTIPAALREGFDDGEELVVINDGSRLILRKASALSEQEKEDLEFSMRTEEGWKEHDRGEYVETGSEEFLKELQRW